MATLKSGYDMKQIVTRKTSTTCYLIYIRKGIKIKYKAKMIAKKRLHILQLAAELPPL